MELVKIIGIGILSAIAALILKKSHKELAVLLTAAASVLILSMILEYLGEAFGFIKRITEFSGITGGMFSIIIKITLIAFIVEFACGFIKEAGEEGLSDKVALAGKIVILYLSFPVIEQLTELIFGIAK